MTTLSIASLFVLATAALATACAAESKDGQSLSTDDALVASSSDTSHAALPPAPPANGQQCSSQSIAPCVGSTRGGACFVLGVGPGICASFQSPAQWITLPLPQTSGWDCNLCVPEIPPPPPGLEQVAIAK